MNVAKKFELFTFEWVEHFWLNLKFFADEKNLISCID